MAGVNFGKRLISLNHIPAIRKERMMMQFKIDWPQRGHGYTDLEIAAVSDLMRDGTKALTQGAKVREFEEAFAQYVGVEKGKTFATMSCAHALDITAMLLEIKPGDEIIIPSHTYCASALAFARKGAVLKWADIDQSSLTVSFDSICKLISSKTKAIVVVHLYGLLSPEIRAISEYCKDKNIYLIEDCAQALGAHDGGRHAGTFGDVACYSFHAQKNLTTLGEGGLIYTRSESLAKKVPGLRLNGHAPFREQEYYWLPAMTNLDVDVEGVWPMKSTMTEVQAIVGSHVLKRLDELTGKRRLRGNYARTALKNCHELRFQKIHSETAHSHHLLPALCQSEKFSRNELILVLAQEYGVKTIIQYHPLHRYDLFKRMGFGIADVPHTDNFFDNMVSFPFSLEISDEDFEYEIQSIKSAIEYLRNR